MLHLRGGGREKVAGNPADLAKKKAEEEAAAKEAAANAGPKRKLNKIHTGVVVAKADKVVNLESGKGLGSKGGGSKGGGGKGSNDQGGRGSAGGSGSSGSSGTGGGGRGHGSSSTPAASSASSSASAVDAAPSEATIVLKEWQRLPRQILQQMTDKQKSPKPEFQLHRYRGELRCKVKIKVPKGRELTETTYDCPVSAAGPQDAYQKAALYALYTLTPTVAHHRVLPSPYKELWAEWQTAPPPPPPQPPAGGSGSGGGGSSIGAGASGKGAGGSTGRGGGGRGRGGAEKAPELTLSEEGREAAMHALRAVSLGERAMGLPPMPTLGSESEEKTSKLVKELRALGFAEDAAATAAEHVVSTPNKDDTDTSRGVRDRAIDWLCLSLPENELPLNFQVKQRVQIVRATRRSAAPDHAAPGSELPPIMVSPQADADDEGTVEGRLCAHGFSRAEVTKVLTEANGCELGAILLLADALARTVTSDGDAVDLSEDGESFLSGDEAVVAEEAEVLAAIYGEDAFQHEHEALRSATGDAVRTFTIRLDALEPLAGTLLLYLRVAYPSQPAAAFFRPHIASALSPDARLAVNRGLAQQAANLSRTRAPAAYELATWLEDCPYLSGTQPPARRHGTLYGNDEEIRAEGSEPRPVKAPGENARAEEWKARSTADDEEASLNGSDLLSDAATAGASSARARAPPRRSPKPLSMDSAAARQASAVLAAEQELLDSSPKHAALRTARALLPAFNARGDLLEALAASRVVVVSGETGCGKSTQVPQYLLEDACRSGTGGACQIVVTQPRRIAAIALAERVATERGSTAGGVVGYAVRLESKVGKDTRLLYCTTGVLLQKLRDDPHLRTVSHVVVDEVHERSLDSDFLLIVIRDALAANPNLKVVLMSATVNADRFVDYFTVSTATGGETRGSRKPGKLSIPGRTFPIDDFFLEDAIEATGYVARGKVLLRGEAAEEEFEAMGAAQATAAAATDDAEGSLASGYSERTRGALQRIPAGNVPADLIASLISKLDADADAVEVLAPTERPDGANRGAVLIFLPGVPEIKRLAQDLARAPGAARWLLLTLHGELPAQEQRRVFSKPPQGVRKVILSTNVAETSLTIDDVTVVLDSGRVKEASYDALNATAKLEETWAARSSRRQRRGRAGRVQRGQYWALYSHAQERRLPDETPPEILRVPLENLYLQVKAMGSHGGDARAFLGRALQPPTKAALDAACRALRHVGALVGGPPLPDVTAAGGGGGGGSGAAYEERKKKRSPEVEAKLAKWVAAKRARDFATADKLRDELRKAGVDAEAAAARPGTDAAAAASPAAASTEVAETEELTPLGLHLARMPLDARVGKLLIYGAILGCIEPALTMAAAMSLSRSPFLSPMERRQEAQQAHARFATERSDHMKILRAYEAWERERESEGVGRARRFAEANFLSANGMEELHGIRKSLRSSLVETGFVPRPVTGRTDAPGAGVREREANLVRALICVGMYPNLVKVRMPEARYEMTASGAVEHQNEEARAVKFFEVPGSRVFLHPSCAMFSEATWERTRWLVFTSKRQVGGPVGPGKGGSLLQADQSQSKTYVQDVTAVSPLALLLFGGKVDVHHDRGTVTIDGKITFESPGRVAVPVRELRANLDKLLSQKIQEPGMDITSHPIVTAIVNLLATERGGFA